MKKSKWTGSERNSLIRKNMKSITDAMGAKSRRRAREASKQELYDLPRLLSHARPEGECMIWEGLWTTCFDRVKPVLHNHGEIKGYVYADNAILQIKLGRKLEHRCFPARTCGNYQCVAPAHLYETSIELERTRRLHGRSERPVGDAEAAYDGEGWSHAVAGQDLLGSD